MTIFYDDDAPVYGLSPKKPAQAQSDVPISQTLGAAFETGNSIVSEFESAHIGLRRNLEYDSFANIQGYEEFADAFIEADSDEDVALIKSDIDREKQNRKILDESGTFGTMSLIAAGITDPTTFIPIGGQATRAYKVGGSILKGAAEVGTAGLVSTTAQEALLQSSQKTRSFEESVNNIAAATVLSGVLGGTIAGVKSSFIGKTEKHMTVPPPQKPDIDEAFIKMNNDDLIDSVGAAAARNTTKQEETLKKAFGLEKAASFLSPDLRLSNSAAVESRRTVQRLSETPFYYEKNDFGIANPVSVQTRVKLDNAKEYKAFDSLRAEYKAYREANKGAKGLLSLEGFSEEVGKAMRRSDTHPIPQIQKAARAYRKELFDPLKDDAIRQRLLPEDVSVSTAESYFMRVYNKRKITGRAAEWKGIVKNWLRQDEELTANDIDIVADEITNTILGLPEGSTFYKPIPLTRGPLKERVFNIPDELIEDFLVSDVRHVGRSYLRTMSPDIHLTKEFGDVTLKSEIGKITQEYGSLIEKAKNEKEANVLRERLKRDLHDIEALVATLRGQYGQPKNPDSWFVRSGRIARQLNFISKLGGMTISAIPDLARPVMTNGILRVVKSGLVPMLKNWKQFKVAAHEARFAGNAAETIASSRAMSMSSLDNLYVPGTRFEKGLQALSNNFGNVVLMNQWNDALKGFSGVVVQARILGATRKMTKGDQSYLAMLGIDNGMLQRIGEQFKLHGIEEDGLFIARTEQWTDKQAKLHFQAALTKEIDRTIVTPGAGSLPLWMSGEMGKVIGQFKSFAFASTQKVLISGLQQDKAMFLNGMIIATSFGALSYYLKRVSNGEGFEDVEPQDWVREGIDRSGVTGILSDANALLEKSTRGGVGVSALMGRPPLTRFANTSAIGMALGPSFGTASDILQVTGAAGAGEWSPQDTRALRRLIPYQNLFMTRALFNEAEKGINEAIGASD
jgi:hypothetical protein